MNMKGIMTDVVSGDLLVSGGSIAVGDTEGQTAEAVLVTGRGEVKEHPLLGGEAWKLRGGSAGRMWAGDVREMLRGCGVECECVRVDGGIIRIER